MLTSVALALAAAASAAVPVLVLQHRAAAPTVPVFAGSTVLYSVPVSGGVPKPVRRLEGQWYFPAATPDGGSLLFERPYASHTEVWRVPLGHGDPTLLGTMQMFTAPPQPGPNVASLSRVHGRTRLTMRASGGIVIWRWNGLSLHATDPQASPDGSSAVIMTEKGIELVDAYGTRFLTHGTALIDPAFSADGTTVYMVGVNAATSIPK